MSLVSLIDSVLLALVILTWVMVPILGLVHELGHAAAVIRAGKRPVVIIGQTPALIIHRFRKFDLHIHPQVGLDQLRTPLREIPESVYECWFDARGLTVGQLRSIYSAGPHASILAAMLFTIVVWFAPVGSLLFMVAAPTAVFAWIVGLANLIPIRPGGRVLTDGAKMAQIQGFDADLVLVAADDRGQVFLPANRLGKGSGSRAGGGRVGPARGHSYTAGRGVPGRQDPPA